MMFKDGTKVLIKSHADVFLVDGDELEEVENVNLEGKVGIIKGYDPSDFAPTEDNNVAWIPVYVDKYFLWLLPDEIEIIE